MHTLETVIKQYVTTESPNSKGWHPVQCKVCHDHNRKGLRGNFLFSNDVVVYKCWNCGILAKYSAKENDSIPKNMINVLNAFGVPQTEYQKIVLFSEGFSKKGSKKTSTNDEILDIEPAEITSPKYFYSLKDADSNDDIAQEALSYLIDERGIDPTTYPFMLAKKTTNKKLDKWLGRLIIPIYKDNKLIYYIGRALYDATKKYETPAKPKERILYGFDELFNHSTKPLLIVEGWFDAYSINGVCIFGNKITPHQAEWLNRSSREKIYIPDRFGDGRAAAEQALEYGWSISTPNIGSNCKDMNDAVLLYGKLYVMNSIIEHKTNNSFSAKTQLGNYCR